ncbi:UNKNOWN [Stylonychia lemnae]|uniref:Uncharacterized protein n=1 Tax=Stylonychia lemnae TaxID=5949 RepID=A0A078A8R5_STYLE|nr:UNKNOWN [Stylonychia lemnae]|eukprot:CDW77922.1 UNKNOWN [Stylonychia lemnae]
MVESQIKDQIETADSGVSHQEFMLKYLNNETFRANNQEQVEITFNGSGKIEMFRAAFVFSTQERRGNNEGLLKELIGICDIDKTLIQFDKGFHRDLEFYPMGVPKQGLTFHNLLSSAMIGKTWREYLMHEPDPQLTLLATFNVMHHFMFQVSQNDIAENKRIEYLDYLRRIYDQVLPFILEQMPELKQFILSEARSLQSNDVLNTMLSLGICKALMKTEYKQINKKALFQSLIIKNIQRQQKSQKIRIEENLLKIDGFDMLVLFSPLIINHLNQQQFESKKVLDEYSSLVQKKKDLQQKCRKGVNQFVSLMCFSRFRKYFTYESVVNIWFQSFRVFKTKYFDQRSKNDYELSKSELNKTSDVQVGGKRKQANQSFQEEEKQCNSKDQDNPGQLIQKRQKYNDDDSQNS